jgi:hypothetical protein
MGQRFPKMTRRVRDGAAVMPVRRRAAHHQEGSERFA